MRCAKYGAQMPWAGIWGRCQPITLPVLGFLPHFSSSFKIKTRDIPRWDFLFSACNLFFSLPNDLTAKSKVYSSSHFPSLLYFSKLSLGLTQLVVSKVLHSIKLRILLLWGSWKTTFSAALYRHKCLKDRKLTCVHNCPNTELRKPQMLLTELLPNSTPFLQKIRTCARLHSFVSRGRVEEHSHECYICNHIFTVPPSALAPSYLLVFELTTQRQDRLCSFHLRAEKSGLSIKSLQSSACILASSTESIL